MNYQDFDLLIDRSGENLRAQVLNSPAGQATAEFRLPFSEDKLENFLLRLGGRTRRTTRRVEIAGDERGQDVRRRAVQRRVQRRRQGVFPQQLRRSPAAERRPAHPPAARRSERRRSAVGIPLQPGRQSLPRAVDPHAARALHGPAGADPADRGHAADPRAGDDLQSHGLSHARRRGGVDAAERGAGGSDRAGTRSRSSGSTTRRSKRCSGGCGASGITSFTSSATASSTRTRRKAC